MKSEIEAAVSFIARIAGGGSAVSEEKLAEFRRSLSDRLSLKFRDHWFPENPCRGNAYRCIRLNKSSLPDVNIAGAAEDAGLKYADLKLPVEIALWIDPKEVCCRFGEDHDERCPIASFDDQGRPISPEDSAPAPSPAARASYRRQPTRMRPQSNTPSPATTPSSSPTPSSYSSPTSSSSPSPPPISFPSPPPISFPYPPPAVPISTPISQQHYEPLYYPSGQYSFNTYEQPQYQKSFCESTYFHHQPNLNYNKYSFPPPPIVYYTPTLAGLTPSCVQLIRPHALQLVI